MNSALNATGADKPYTLPLPVYLRIHDVLRITGLSRPTIYRRIAAKRFPPSVNLGGRACGWPSTAVQTWINDPEGYRLPYEPSGSLASINVAANIPS